MVVNVWLGQILAMIKKCCHTMARNTRSQQSTNSSTGHFPNVWKHVANQLATLCQKRSSCPMEKTHQVMCYSLPDYGRLKWRPILQDLDKALDAAYQDVLDEFDSVWCIKGLIVTHNNLTVIWKIRALDEHCFLISLGKSWVGLPRIVVLVTLAIEFVSICAKNKVKWHNWLSLDWVGLIKLGVL